jgi:hypothetical protein
MSSIIGSFTSMQGIITNIANDIGRDMPYLMYNMFNSFTNLLSSL